MTLSEAEEGDEVTIRLRCLGSGRYSDRIRILEAVDGHQVLFSVDTEIESIHRSGDDRQA